MDDEVNISTMHLRIDCCIEACDNMLVFVFKKDDLFSTTINKFFGHMKASGWIMNKRYEFVCRDHADQQEM
jgi:hypothetical protein